MTKKTLEQLIDLRKEIMELEKRIKCIYTNISACGVLGSV